MQRRGGGNLRLRRWISSLGVWAEAKPFELADLEAEKVDLTCQLTVCRLRGRQDAGRALEDSFPSLVDLGRADTAEVVQCLALGRLVEQGLMGMLAWRSTSLVPEIGEGLSPWRCDVDVRRDVLQRGSVAHDALVAPAGGSTREATLDDRWGRRRFYEGGVGPSADEQLEGLDDEGSCRRLFRP